MNPTDDSNLVVEGTDANFDSLIKEGDVVVDFWAEWCGPCRMIAPQVKNFAKKYNGKIKFIKVDTDKNPELSGKYRIMSIPQLYFFRNGEIIGEQKGAYPEHVFEQNFTKAFGIDGNNSSMPMAA